MFSFEFNAITQPFLSNRHGNLHGSLYELSKQITNYLNK